MIIFFILFLTIVPILIGSWISSMMKKKYNTALMYHYIVGIIALLSLFQLICIPCTFLKVKFDVLTLIYSGTVLGLTFIAAWQVIIVQKMALTKFQDYRKNRHQLSGFEWIAVGLLLFQVATSVIKMPEYIYSGDDATYIAMAGDAIGNNTIYLTDYMTGMECELAEVSPKYTLTSYNMFTAYLAKISGVHILILCKTILPICVIFIAYMVFTLLGKMLFENDGRTVGIFLSLLGTINICSGFSNYTLTFRLLVCSWQGKAILATVILPFLFYQMFQMIEGQDTFMEYFIIFMGIIAATSVTLMGVGLAPILIIVAALVLAIQQKNIKLVIKSGICCVPCAVYLAVYIFYDKILVFCNSVGLW